MKKIEIKLGERDILALSFAGLTLVFLVQVAASYLSARSCSHLAKGADAVLVQQPDGTSFLANPKPPNYRDPMVVRNYVHKWVTHTFSLPGSLATSGDKKVIDSGVFMGREKVPVNVVSGSFALTAKKRSKFVQAFANEGWIPEDYFSSSPTTKLLEIDELGQPQLIDKKEQIYAVNVVATVSSYKEGEPTGEVDFYRRKIIVAPIPVPQKVPDENAPIYEQLSYQWSKEGLRIDKINPLSFRE